MVACRRRAQSPLRWPASSLGSSDSGLSPARRPAHPRALALAVTLGPEVPPCERPCSRVPSVLLRSPLRPFPRTLPFAEWPSHLYTRLAGADRVGPAGAHGPATGRLSVWTKATPALDVEGWLRGWGTPAPRPALGPLRGLRSTRCGRDR